jgi:membrane-associated phospholipid phosphatase
VTKTSVKNFFYKMPQNIARAFSGRNVFWHLFAIIVTYGIVVSGFDWRYYIYFRGTIIERVLFAAVIAGGLVPVFLPLFLWVWGALKKKSEEKHKILAAAFTLGQGAMAGYLVSIFYKAFTGRMHPLLHDPLAHPLADISRQFQFGFLRGGVFWGWPSSHTAVAFAMAFSLITLFPKNKAIKYGAIAYALFIGLGVSMSIHWFSDFAAGALIGSVVGACVGKSFRHAAK